MGNCRGRRIRCTPAHHDTQNGCQNCVNRKMECDKREYKQRVITSQQICYSDSPTPTTLRASQPQHQLPPWTTYGSVPATVSCTFQNINQYSDTAAIGDGICVDHQLEYPIGSYLLPDEYSGNTYMQSYSDTSRATTQEYQHPESFWPYSFPQNAPESHVDQVDSVSSSLKHMGSTRGDEIRPYGLFPTTLDPPQFIAFKRPDLYERLRIPQSSPPSTDEAAANPKLDSEDSQTAQEDLYTPRWIRGAGKDREAWCGYCKTGKWFNRRNSAYWYHLLRVHGVRPSTGQRMEEPIAFKISAYSKTQALLGLCECNEWVMLLTEPGVQRWFIHVAECPKMREKEKRRLTLQGPVQGANSRA